MESVEERVIKIIAAQLKIKDKARIKRDADFYELGANSIDITDIANALEAEFGMSISETESVVTWTVQRAIDYAAVHKKE
ncbi:acyl carrier protein [Pseudomonas sp. ADAK2]|uniref:acyl carrier protein n=1 Tax=Pseudomonas TaxID=286 RepID=UPI00146375EB|nr:MULTISPECIES: acyl carrier protein [unclassified Pseudomonas]QJI41964.1 acyl carrier protein [Pseudomonas sp. ADAK7]QJI48267.1 acyl carrier protein [Pseudomonas sp. ADAK2]